MEERAVRITEYTESLFPEILALYRDAGWTNYTRNPDMLANAYKNSLRILCAYCGASIAGVVRAVGDGCSILYVQDLLVHSSFQRRGIGGRLLDTLFSEYPNVYQTILLADGSEELSRFYRKCGFQPAGAYGCVAYFRRKLPD